MGRSAFVEVPSHSLLVDLNESLEQRADLYRSFLDVMILELGLTEAELQITTGKGWRRYSRKSRDACFEDRSGHSVVVMVGHPVHVRLTAGWYLRPQPKEVDREGWRVWFACESSRWPSATVERFAQAWMRLAAQSSAPSSGGAMGAETLLDALNMVAPITESPERLACDEVLYRDWLRLDSWLGAKRPPRQFIRRISPLTLLGPRFASEETTTKLRTAGAEVERVKDSLIVRAYPKLVSPWSTEFLAATAELRRIAWPITVQNPADAAGLPGKPQYEVPKPLGAPPPGQPPREELVKEYARQMADLKKAMAGVLLGTGGELSVAG